MSLAFTDFEQVTRVVLCRPEDYNNRGVVRQALGLDPSWCVAHISRGNAHYHSRDGLASADYEAAFRLDPEAVLKSCRTHLRHDPDDIMAYARRGLTLLWLGRDADAGPDFDRMRQLEPEWRPHLDLWIEGVARHLAP